MPAITPQNPDDGPRPGQRRPRQLSETSTEPAPQGVSHSGSIPIRFKSVPILKARTTQGGNYVFTSTTYNMQNVYDHEISLTTLAVVGRPGFVFRLMLWPPALFVLIWACIGIPISILGAIAGWETTCFTVLLMATLTIVGILALWCGILQAYYDSRADLLMGKARVDRKRRGDRPVPELKVVEAGEWESFMLSLSPL